MSRIGKQPIPVPSGVKVQLDGNTVVVEGKGGRLSLRYSTGLKVEYDAAGSQIRITRPNDERQMRSLHGLTRKLIANMVQGVSSGFTRVLEISGVGYRAEARGNVLFLTLGYSHPIAFQLPPTVSAKVDRQVVVTLESADAELLGQITAQIRALRPPEPYKGKGVKRAGETIRRKAGKAAAGASR
jgi:large subunit ribosomal protein L6